MSFFRIAMWRGWRSPNDDRRRNDPMTKAATNRPGISRIARREALWSGALLRRFSQSRSFAVSPVQRFNHSTLQRRAGFSLLELLIVLGIVAMALAALIPAVTSLAKSGGRRAALNSLLGGIEQARAEAIKSGQATYVVFPTFGAGTAQSTVDRYNYRSYTIFEDNAASPGNVKQLTDWKSFPVGVALRAAAYTINGASVGALLSYLQDPGWNPQPPFTPDNGATLVFRCIKFNSNGEVQAPIFTPTQPVYFGVFEGYVTNNGSEVATTKDANGNPSAVDYVMVPQYTGRAELAAIP